MSFIKDLYNNLLEIYLSAQKFRLVDFTKLDLIRNATTEELQNREFLEEQILNKVGLNDERPQAFPKELRGFGLYQAQYPIQFAPYLIELSKYKIEYYLEVGVRHGGTFFVTTEYLLKFNNVKRAVAVDIGLSRSIEKYCLENSFARFFKMNSTSNDFVTLVANMPRIDLALIDAGHSYDECKADVKKVIDRAGIIVIHDIVNHSCPGVAQVWSELKEIYNKEFTFIEFADQYPDILSNTKKQHLGIGMAIKNDFIKEFKKV